MPEPEERSVDYLTEPKPPSHEFRFSLRTLLVGFVLIALAAAVIASAPRVFNQWILPRLKEAANEKRVASRRVLHGTVAANLAGDEPPGGLACELRPTSQAALMSSVSIESEFQ